MCMEEERENYHSLEESDFDDIIQDLRDDFSDATIQFETIYSHLRWGIDISFRGEKEYSEIHPYLYQIINRCEDINVYMGGITIKLSEFDGQDVFRSISDRFYETLPNEDEIKYIYRVALYLTREKQKRGIISTFKNFISRGKTPYEYGNFNDDY